MTEPDPYHCARTACKQSIGGIRPRYWNSSTRAWYCHVCARHINAASPNLCVHESDLPHDFEVAFTKATESAAKAGWLVINEPLDQTITRVSVWLRDLHSGMYINCVYCGHRYGPKENTPVVMADVLKAHIRECPAHPLSKALKALKLAEHAIDDASGVVDKGDDESEHAYERELAAVREAIAEIEK